MTFHIGSKLFTFTESLTFSRYYVIVMSEIAMELKGENKNFIVSWHQNIRGRDRRRFVFYTSLYITKTCLYNLDPLKPHFYIIKLGFIGVYIIFLILLENIDCGHSLEPPRRGGSNEYPQPMF